MMPVHWMYCGTQFPDTAAFCLTCGKPTKGVLASAETSPPKVEYKQIHLDLLLQQPFIEDKTMGTGSLRPENDFAKGQADMAAHQRIRHIVMPYLNDGWELDGSFHEAVQVLWKDVGKLLSFKGRLAGAAVKLRRQR